MAGQSLDDWQNLQIRARPRKQGVYVAKQSFPDGITPDHLKGYTDDFSDASKECARETSELEGNARVKAMNGCVAQKLK